VTIDLTKPIPPPAKRSVVLRLTTPDGSMPKGAIHVRVASAGGGYSERDDISVPLQNGSARVDAYTGGNVFYEPPGLIGYWFDGGSRQVEPGPEPLEIVVSVCPAGAIAGRVFNADGKPCNGTDVTVSLFGRLVKTSSGHTVSTEGGFGVNNIRADSQGRFWINPLPLGGIYTVTVKRGHALRCSEPIELNGVKPTAEVTLSLPRTTVAEGKVLDADGNPLVVPLGLNFLSSTKKLNRGSSSQGWGDDKTDKQGRFRFGDLGIGGGEYFLYFKPRRDFQPCRVPLPLDGKPIEVRLNRGLVLEGEVVDNATGRPAAGLELVAMPAKLTPESIGHYQAEALTDDSGRFRFSNLGDQPYEILFVGGPQVIRKSPNDYAETWEPGEPSVSIRVKIPEWYRPRQ
jgi:hypothetical protein